ncbi:MULTISPECIES: hypothetical protein [unclassified Lysinibacillus]|uniref:hypothetical protein n=1 Tax=unclassified Lysinibacillus TaxID=2636778 RepID=UPI00131ED3F5|nr:MULTISPECIES: hypothetical protein [unclassified Lysinibacillus]
MKNKKVKKEKQDGLFKEMLGELTSSIIFEVAWNILMFIPKMIIRLIKNIW